MISLRDMHHDDYLQVYNLYKQVAQLHIDNRQDIYNEGEFLTKKIFNQLLIDDNIIPIVAIKNGEVVGISVLSLKLPEDLGIHKTRQIGYIDTFCIDAKHKKMGIGQQLFNKTVDVANECFVDSLELMVWKFNEEAIEFYKKMGLTTQSIIMEMALKKY